MIQKNLEKRTKEVDSFIKESPELKEVKLLLDSNAQIEQHLLLNAFPGSLNSFTNDLSEKRKRVFKMEEMYGGKIYSNADIKDIAIKYRLRFLPSTLYKGVLPTDVLHKLREVISKNEDLYYLKQHSSKGYSMSLNVLAPAGMFNLEGVKKNELAERKRLRDLDPALFLKIEDDKWLFIKEWGNSFSPLRRVLGFLLDKHWKVNFLFFLVYSLTVLAFVELDIFLFSKYYTKPLPLILCCIFAAIQLLFIFIAPLLDDDNTLRILSKYKGSSGWFNMDKRIVSENCWNSSDKL